MAEELVDTKEEGESTRRQFRNDEWTEEQVAARKTELTVEEAPKGWVKLAEVSNACREAEIPVSKLVRATGGDRCMNDPIDPLFTVVYVGRTRYMKPQVLTTGMKKLADPEFMPTKRRKKAATEDEGEGKPAKKAPAKKTRKKVSVRPAPGE